MHGSIRMGWVPQPMCYFTTLFYLTAPCGLANPQGFHGSGLDLSIQAERSVGQGIALYPIRFGTYPQWVIQLAFSPRGAACL